MNDNFTSDEPALGTIGEVKWQDIIFLCRYQLRDGEPVWGNGAVYFKKNTLWRPISEASKELVFFKNLALGAKFKYQNSTKIWIKISDQDYGLIAEYQKELMHVDWVGQQICSFANSKPEKESLMVVPID